AVPPSTRVRLLVGVSAACRARSRGMALARSVQGRGLANELPERVLVDVVVLPDVDSTPDLPFEAGVEQARRIVQRSAFEERELDHVLVCLARADDAGAGPDRRSGVRGPHPLPLLDDVGLGLPDDRPHPRERRPAPVAELPNALVDQPGSTPLALCHADSPSCREATKHGGEYRRRGRGSPRLSRPGPPCAAARRWRAPSSAGFPAPLPAPPGRRRGSARPSRSAG